MIEPLAAIQRLAEARGISSTDSLDSPNPQSGSGGITERHTSSSSSGVLLPDQQRISSCAELDDYEDDNDHMKSLVPMSSYRQHISREPAHAVLFNYRGERVAGFEMESGLRHMICLPQVYELFLKQLVGGLHTVYTKLKRLNIHPLICNVEQVRALRSLGAIQPGVNRCKLIEKMDFDKLYDDCTNTGSRPGRPPKRSPTIDDCWSAISKKEKNEDPTTNSSMLPMASTSTNQDIYGSNSSLDKSISLSALQSGQSSVHHQQASNHQAQLFGSLLPLTAQHLLMQHMMASMVSASMVSQQQLQNQTQDLQQQSEIRNELNQFRDYANQMTPGCGINSSINDQNSSHIPPPITRRTSSSGSISSTGNRKAQEWSNNSHNRAVKRKEEKNQNETGRSQFGNNQFPFGILSTKDVEDEYSPQSSSSNGNKSDEMSSSSSGNGNVPLNLSNDSRNGSCGKGDQTEPNGSEKNEGRSSCNQSETDDSFDREKSLSATINDRSESSNRSGSQSSPTESDQALQFAMTKINTMVETADKVFKSHYEKLADLIQNLEGELNYLKHSEAHCQKVAKLEKQKSDLYFRKYTRLKHETKKLRMRAPVPHETDLQRVHT
ncbi:SKI/SNO/DAC family domain-containing protein [Ditylenchus destructor]|uniref:SKI/SNO/DAC family domain-containing protein n=1 Tax=Ditylenchus destructor TaxID=166010 RepID=A0AAD4NIN1_9BILA|nr:SKI/SNO/DAC family domain-containing protein [Ditylenchus destructor]